MTEDHRRRPSARREGVDVERLLRQGRRPRNHKIVGIVLAALGVGLIVVNYGEELGLSVLPGGHQELWFYLGLLVAGSSSWWFGLFDRADGRPSSVDRRR